MVSSNDAVQRDNMNDMNIDNDVANTDSSGTYGIEASEPDGKEDDMGSSEDNNPTPPLTQRHPPRAL